MCIKTLLRDWSLWGGSQFTFHGWYWEFETVGAVSINFEPMLTYVAVAPLRILIDVFPGSEKNLPIHKFLYRIFS